MTDQRDEYFIDTAMTLGFPPLTEAEKLVLVARAAQELAYETAASARAIANADERRQAQAVKRMRAVLSGGFVWHPPLARFRPNVPISYAQHTDTYRALSECAQALLAALGEDA